MNTFFSTISEVIDRDLSIVIEELKKYNSEDNMWLNPDGINNPTGTLALHLAGNLQHFIGTVLGNSGYKRNRNLEFSRRDVSREELISELTNTRKVVKETLAKLTDSQLDENYPLLFPDKTVSMQFILIHLAGHLNYHLGQINYLRRLTE